MNCFDRVIVYISGGRENVASLRGLVSLIHSLSPGFVVTYLWGEAVVLTNLQPESSALSSSSPPYLINFLFVVTAPLNSMSGSIRKLVICINRPLFCFSKPLILSLSSMPTLMFLEAFNVRFFILVRTVGTTSMSSRAGTGSSVFSPGGGVAGAARRSTFRTYSR